MKFGKGFREEIYDNGEVKNYYIILLNGQPVDREKVALTLLQDGDTLHLFPPVSGG